MKLCTYGTWLLAFGFSPQPLLVAAKNTKQRGGKAPKSPIQSMIIPATQDPHGKKTKHANGSKKSLPPTQNPSGSPSHTPSQNPSGSPSHTPSQQPSEIPSSEPSSEPSQSPTMSPTQSPTMSPTAAPTTRQLVANPGFEDLPEGVGWSYSGPNLFTNAILENSFGGEAANGDRYYFSNGNARLSQNVTIPEGSSWTLSFNVKPTACRADDGFFSISIEASNGTTTFYTLNGGTGSDCFDLFFGPIFNTFNYASIGELDVTPFAGETVELIVENQGPTAAGFLVRVDDIEINPEE